MKEFQVFNLKMSFTSKQNYLQKKSRVLISENANSVSSVVSALGNPALKIF